MDRENISIYTIAKEAGVSPATVSRVLTGNARVSDDKRIKIQDIIEKYDFRPNALARGLSNIETKIIGLLLPDIRNPFHATIAVECERAAKEHGYMTLSCNSLGSNQMELSHLETMAAQRVDAIIQVGGKVDELVSDLEYVENINRIANKIPVLITGRLDGADCYQVNMDEGQSMELLLEYLINCGHHDIAFMGGCKTVKSTMDKRLKYRQVLRRHGIPVREEYIIDEEHYDLDGGYGCMKNFIRQDFPMPDAIIAINDFTAIGIMRALHEHGLLIPQDISLASFDNTYLAETMTPRLTSIGYNYREFGQTLIETAIKAIKGEEPPRIQMIKSQLFKRESCKAIEGQSEGEKHVLVL